MHIAVKLVAAMKGRERKGRLTTLKNLYIIISNIIYSFLHNTLITYLFLQVRTIITRIFKIIL